jgi:peptide deformylase
MILKVLSDKHPSLRQVCQKVDDPSTQTKLALSMLSTLKAHKALGLAANQVGKHIRIIALATPEFQGIMYNPEILEKSEEIFNLKEGCLSMKGKFVDTNARSKTIKVKWQDKSGEYKEQEFTDLTSVVVQHEIDHLDGKLMSDYVR